MDRTVIDTYRAEEKLLSEKLYKKIYGLTLIEAPSEEFLKCFNTDMFLKANQKAFIHVMHFLFNLLDPAEFKKRFYWPVVDKKSESAFRSTTIAYLTQINEKHNLHWTNIKSYLAIMPGGMKFITFLSDFVDFIIKELIKQRIKSLSSDVDRSAITKGSLLAMQEKNKIHKEFASNYISEADGQIVIIKENLNVLHKQINIISKATKVDPNFFMKHSFLKYFDECNRKLFEEKFSKKMQNIMSLEKPLHEMNENIDAFLEKDSICKYDQETLKHCLQQLHQMFPEIDLSQTNSNSNTIPLNTLITAFNCVYPIAREQMSNIEFDESQSDFISSELNSAKSDLLQIDAQLTKFYETIRSDNMKKGKDPTVQTTPISGFSMTENNTKAGQLLRKFINTPPIKLECMEQQDTNPRISLMEDYPIGDSSIAASTSKVFNTMANESKSAKKMSSSKLGQSGNKSKIVGPQELLKSLNKDSSKIKSRIESEKVKSLASRWKDRENLLFGPSKEEIKWNSGEISIYESLNSPNSEVKSELTVENISNQMKCLHLAQGMAEKLNILSVKKISAVKNENLELLNLSTSPSGRLDPLVSFNRNESSQISTKLCEITRNLFNNEHKPNVSEDVFQSSFPIVDSPEEKQFLLENSENDMNSANSQFSDSTELPKFNDEESGTLFDISDSVLQDVTL